MTSLAVHPPSCFRASPDAPPSRTGSARLEQLTLRAVYAVSACEPVNFIPTGHAREREMRGRPRLSSGETKSILLVPREGLTVRVPVVE